MMYKHWKKALLALTAFFWNACEDITSTTDPLYGVPNFSSSSTTEGGGSSSATKTSSSSTESERISSSVFDQNEDLYGCPSVFCGGESSSSNVKSSSSRVAESSSGMDLDPVPLYGIYVGTTCLKKQDDSTITCADGVTCVETSTDTERVTRNNPSEMAAKYGVVIVRDKTYKCDNGKVYNEAEFKANYNILTVVDPENKIRCRKTKNLMECDDGNNFVIATDEKGNTTYTNEQTVLNEKQFFEKYEAFEDLVVLYGPPCVFNGSCGDEEK